MAESPMNTSSSLRPPPPFSHRPDLPIAVVIGAGGLSMAIAQRLGQNHRIVLVSVSDRSSRDEAHFIALAPCPHCVRCGKMCCYKQGTEIGCQFHQPDARSDGLIHVVAVAERNGRFD